MKNDEENIHRCEQNFYHDVGIEYQKINVEQYSWVIDYIWRAKESDVEESAAENVGDIIRMDTILISYCPFCGKRLTDEKKNTC